MNWFRRDNVQGHRLNVASISILVTFDVLYRKKDHLIIWCDY